MTYPARGIALCFLGLLPGLPAAAQSKELFAGFSLANMKPPAESLRTTLNGWSSSFTVYPAYRLGFTIDGAGQYGTANAVGTAALNVRQHSLVAGPQVRLFRRGRIETSAKALFGAARGHLPGDSVSANDETTFAALIGSNLDINLTHRVAFRLSPGMFVTRYGHDFGAASQKNLRLTAGLVFRLGGE